MNIFFKQAKVLSVSDFLKGLKHDHGQTDSRAKRLSSAHHKVTWLIMIGFKYSTARVKQRLPVCKGKGHCKRNVSVLRK